MLHQPKPFLALAPAPARSPTPPRNPLHMRNPHPSRARLPPPKATTPAKSQQGSRIHRPTQSSVLSPQSSVLSPQSSPLRQRQPLHLLQPATPITQPPALPHAVPQVVQLR